MKRRALLEIAAVVGTGAAFAILVQILPKLLVIVPCIAFWLTYVIVRAARDRSVLAEWGLRLDNLRESARLPAIFVVVAAAGIFAFRAIAGLRPLPSWAWGMFLVYPIWSLFQQLFVQSLLAANFVRLGVRRSSTVLITALLFGAVHLPDVPLALLCTLAGAFWTVCFLRVPNLLPLALAHGWIGTLTYAWLLERDPLAFPYP
jgi:hypothetical protein